MFTLSFLVSGSAEGFNQADKAINTAVKSGRWVMLKNVHLAPGWLMQLEKKLHSLQPHACFRLFLTMEINPKVNRWEPLGAGASGVCAHSQVCIRTSGSAGCGHMSTTLELVMLGQEDCCKLEVSHILSLQSKSSHHRGHLIPQVPVNLLRAGRIFVFEPPPGVKANMLRTFSSVPVSRMCKVMSAL